MGIQTRNRHLQVLIVCSAALITSGIIACSGKKDIREEATFTKADSLTDRYLQLQDSMLYAWNNLISDDSRKFNTMHKLLHALLVTGYLDKEELIAMELRLNKITTLSITQESINNASLVEEYDFATSSLLKELLSLAESHESFASNQGLQKMVEEIRLIDQRVEGNRLRYDSVAKEYNRFLEKNKNQVEELDLGISLEKKPLFQIASED
jgi:hypothetical protein